VLQSMLLTKLKMVLGVLLLVGILGLGVGASAWVCGPKADARVAGAQDGSGGAPKKEPEEQPVPRENDGAADQRPAAQLRMLVEDQRATQIVEDTLRKAREQYPDHSGEALELLRNSLVQVWDNADLSERTRNDLLSRLVAGRRQLVEGDRKGEGK